ncbi:UNVERIFIED_CONTAM: putative ribonuclease H protein [Sesamum calycinum]|uniref:Ribonuclease H protein n=1 Tax=Sesamum calycinum TaxID=2727403 RepID=A0AAW2QJM6_9LAMI
MLILWFCWLERKDSKHRGHKFNSNCIIWKVHQFINTISVSKLASLVNWRGDSNIAPTMGFKICIKRRTTLMKVKWNKPDRGWIKINTDGASKGNLGPSGAGGIARDEKGVAIFAFYEFIGEATNMCAEIFGLFKALQLRFATAAAVFCCCVLLLLQLRFANAVAVFCCCCSLLHGSNPMVLTGSLAREGTNSNNCGLIISSIKTNSTKEISNHDQVWNLVRYHSAHPRSLITFNVHPPWLPTIVMDLVYFLCLNLLIALQSFDPFCGMIWIAEAQSSNPNSPMDSHPEAHGQGLLSLGYAWLWTSTAWASILGRLQQKADSPLGSNWFGPQLTVGLH